MNLNIEKLYAIAKKPRRRVIGLMSGTSVDGLDVALCEFSGTGMQNDVSLVQFQTVPYESDYKNEISSIFSKRDADLQKITLLNGWIARQHAKMILECLTQWNLAPEDVDLVASHGQSIFHAPLSLHGERKFGNGTMQLGDGDHMAVSTGIITVSDFRQKHIAAGGEGAPLAAYGDYLIFSKENENRIMLNIGGIANFTFLPGNLDADKVFCSDTGPGNTLMDALTQSVMPGQYFDKNSEMALKGNVHDPLLTALLDHPFFAQTFPKTTGPELFNLQYLKNAMEKCDDTDIPVQDQMATLNRFSAVTIASAIKSVTSNGEKFTFFVSGGGMHNPLLIRNLAGLLPGSVFKSTDELSINPDAKEAVLFAVLANETVCGGSVSFGKGRNGIPNVSMGKISFPG